jgi:hypothetical protein
MLGRPKFTSAALRQATVRHISADDRLSIRAAAAKRRREEMVSRTTYSGDSGATPSAGPGRETLALIGGSELNDNKGYIKNIAHQETFSEIFEGLEFKRPLKKSQVVEDFWSQFQVVFKTMSPLSPIQIQIILKGSRRGSIVLGNFIGSF